MKKNFYKKLAVAAMGTLLVFACAGCSKKEADKENEAVAVVNNMQHASASTDGALLFKDGVVYYSDVKKGVSTPLCTKANYPPGNVRQIMERAREAECAHSFMRKNCMFL